MCPNELEAELMLPDVCRFGRCRGAAERAVGYREWVFLELIGADVPLAAGGWQVLFCSHANP